MPRTSLLLAAFAATVIAYPATANPPPKAKAKPKVEVVFCLDTTGSMSGLIEGAKQKIWAISNQIAGGRPTPDLKVGLVAYRDRGDAYITKVIDLSDDLDAIHAELRKFQAGGGGDTPESVNQALNDAVTKVKWSKDNKTLKIIFLVGDAPPHMDYKDDVKYPETCQKAVENNILINTIQCGGDPNCTKAWKEIAMKSEGTYAAIPQSGGVIAVRTPFDARLAKISAELADTTVTYGAARMRGATEAAVAAVKTLPAASAADRAGFGGKTAKGAAAGDLIDDLKAKKVELSKVKDEELPEALRKLKTPKEREEYLKKIEQQRDELRKEAAELDKKRAVHVAEEMKKGKDKGKDSFDSSVLEMLRKQAKKAGIDY